MTDIDPLVEAEMVEELRYSLAHANPCLEYISFMEDERCGAPAAPDGQPRIWGTDQDENDVYMQKWRCARGHWYLVEV